MATAEAGFVMTASTKAKVFMSGRSQAVRLPKEFRFDCDEVTIERDGDAVILRPLRPAEPWANLMKAVRAACDPEIADPTFPGDRDQPPMPKRPGLGHVFDT